MDNFFFINPFDSNLKKFLNKSFNQLEEEVNENGINNIIQNLVDKIYQDTHNYQFIVFDKFWIESDDLNLINLDDLNVK